jgi:hypothetical protein
MYCTTFSDDMQRFSSILKYRYALEWYYLEHGNYPMTSACGDQYWESTDTLKPYLTKYLYDPIFGTTSTPITYYFPVDTPHPYLYRPYKKTGSSTYNGYCLSAAYSFCPIDNRDCPLSNSDTAYKLFIPGAPNHDMIPYRHTGYATTPESVRLQKDIKRKSDISAIQNAIESYKHTTGYLPQTTSNSWWTAVTLTKYLVPGYLTSLPTDTDYTYSVRMWDPDSNGKYTKYCLSSYMDTISNCSNSCPIPLTGFYCYGVANK